MPVEKPGTALIWGPMTRWGTIRRRAALLLAGLVLLAATPVTAAESPAEQISGFRFKHGEGRVVRDATLDRIALEQARAMAAKNDLSHDVLGPFTRRVGPAGAGRAAFFVGRTGATRA